MTIAKKLTVVGCVLTLGYTLTKWWRTPQIIEINMPFSEYLPDGNYDVMGITCESDHIRIINGKTYAF